MPIKRPGSSSHPDRKTIISPLSLKSFFGSATESSTAQASFFIQKLRDDLTEVKLTLYQGYVSSDLIGESQTETKTVTNSIVTKPKVYQNWFTALEKEVESRKAMMQQSSDN